MTEQQIQAIGIGDEVPVISKPGMAPVEAREYEVNGLPEDIPIRAYRDRKGWYFSEQPSEYPTERKQSNPQLPQPGQHFASQDQFLDALQQYLRGYHSH